MQDVRRKRSRAVVGSRLGFRLSIKQMIFPTCVVAFPNSTMLFIGFIMYWIQAASLFSILIMLPANCLSTPHRLCILNNVVDRLVSWYHIDELLLAVMSGMMSHLGVDLKSCRVSTEKLNHHESRFSKLFLLYLAYFKLGIWQCADSSREGSLMNHNHDGLL